ncbi:hypothetical protein ABPG75_001315 [Micractinium tetrahymenae]
MADTMYRVFWQQHSQSAIPHRRGAAGSSVSEFEYLGCRLIKVSEPLYRILAASKHHPTLDQLWERHYQKLLAIPDHVWREGDEADRYRCALIQTLLASFPKYLWSANLKVKVLPAGNQSIIVAVLPRCPRSGRRVEAEGALYVADLAALSLDEVHRRLQRSDPYFDCNFDHCACLPIALEDAAIAAIAKAHSVSESRLRRELR